MLWSYTAWASRAAASAISGRNRHMRWRSVPSRSGTLLRPDGRKIQGHVPSTQQVRALVDDVSDGATQRLIQRVRRLATLMQHQGVAADGRVLVARRAKHVFSDTGQLIDLGHVHVQPVPGDTIDRNFALPDRTRRAQVDQGAPMPPLTLSAPGIGTAALILAH